MLQVKIVSNPYENTISYFKNDENIWSPVDNDNSKLIKAEYLNGVFPFSAKKIVDIIIEEYKEDNKKLDIVFEGTDDEYKDLKKLCSNDNYKTLVNVIKSDRYLNNGSSIIKKVERLCWVRTAIRNKEVYSHRYHSGSAAGAGCSDRDKF